jgi:hypothetical protein
MVFSIFPVLLVLYLANQGGFLFSGFQKSFRSGAGSRPRGAKPKNQKKHVGWLSEET